MSVFVLFRHLVPGMNITDLGIGLHVMAHGLVDFLKARGYLKQIWQDQLCHWIEMLALMGLGLL